MTLVEFLTARLAEDETAAVACPPWPWRIDPHVCDEETVLAADDIPVAEVFALSGPQTRATGAHIARHDPARVLREVEAKRRLLHYVTPDLTDSHHQWLVMEAEDREVLQILASVYADHPDYREEWA